MEPMLAKQYMFAVSIHDLTLLQRTLPYATHNNMLYLCCDVEAALLCGKFPLNNAVRAFHIGSIMCHNQQSDFKKVIFVLSVPGEAEEKAGFPAAGDTGLKLNAILKHLNRDLANVFPYDNKEKYTITNSYDKPIYPSNNSKKHSQPTKSQVLSTGNIDRFKREVEGYEYIILCGKDAQLLKGYVTTGTCISVSHLGNKALRTMYPNTHPEIEKITSGEKRDEIRVKLCAQSIINEINKCPN